MTAEYATGDQPPEPAGRDARASGITTKPIRWAVLALALPVLGEQLLNSFIALVDTFLAGQLSKEATAAVGLAAYVEWLATMLFALVATGTTALVARRSGAGDRDGANLFANQSITLSLFSGLVFSALLYALAPTFAGLQEMTGRTYDITVEYLRIDSLALTFTSVTLVGAAALRGAGDTRTPIVYAHATVSAGARLQVPWRSDFNALAYVLAGRGEVGSDRRPIQEGQLAAFGGGDQITVIADTQQDSKSPTLEILLLGGSPIKEKIAWYGPFVMNTREELMQAVEDYQAGKMGSIPAKPSAAGEG